jgi:hypothetical protein
LGDFRGENRAQPGLRKRTRQLPFGWRKLKVIVGNCGVLSRNPVIRAAAVLFLDICP